MGGAAEYSIRTVRLTARAARRVGRWAWTGAGHARRRGGAGDLGMIRLLDLHAASCAADTLVTLGLAGTIFFNAPVGEARGRVAGYLLLTMAPFALLAPVVGPVLDRFRHGRRYALAITMLGRAALAWLLSSHLTGLLLYPAAFGILALSRAYGVARSAAVPRLLPPGLGLSEAGARASAFGTVAGAVVAPVGVIALWFGAAWPLRIAAVLFVAGAVVALRLPPRADAEPPESVPALYAWPGRHPAKVLTGRPVLVTLAGSAMLRGLYGFLALVLAFAIRAGQVPTAIFGLHLPAAGAIGLLAGALGAGSLLATVAGSRLAIRRPIPVQVTSLIAVAVAGGVAAIRGTFASVLLFCLVTAAASGLAKLAVDATIQNQVLEAVRASAFAHSETLLMLAWVAGGALGLIPFGGSAAVIIAAATTAVATVPAVAVASRMRQHRLAPRRGHPRVTGPPEGAAERADGNSAGRAAEAATPDRS